MYDPKENVVLSNQTQVNMLHMEQRFDLESCNVILTILTFCMYNNICQ